MKRILTGDRPTGKLHLGHFVGSLKNRISLQDKYETFLIIADLHTLTTKNSKEDIKKLPENIYNQVLDYLAVGVDPNKVTIYLQSKIPAVYQLYLIFNMLISVPRLHRVPTLKDVMKDAHITIPSFGLLGYPVLQAADILMVNADLVPVGKDQDCHIEIAREVARKFNLTYGKIFNEPKSLIGEVPTLPGIDGLQKMSKSAGNTILLSDSESEVKDKIKEMYTDPQRIHISDPGKVEGNPIFIYHDAFNDNTEEVKDLKDRYRQGKVGDVEVKDKLAKALNRFLEPIRERRNQYDKKPQKIYEIIEQGSKKTALIAEDILIKSKSAMGIDYDF